MTTGAISHSILLLQVPQPVVTMGSTGMWIAPAEWDFNFRQITRNAERDLTGYCSWDNSLLFLARNVNTNRVSYELRRVAGICQLATSNFVRDVITDTPHCLLPASFSLLSASSQVKINTIFKNVCIYLLVSSFLGICPKKLRAILPVPTLQTYRKEQKWIRIQCERDSDTTT